MPRRFGPVRFVTAEPASPQPASAVSRALSEFHRLRVGEAKTWVPALARAAATRGGVLHLEHDPHVAGNPAAHFDWPDAQADRRLAWTTQH
jgi:hypothetical protein